MIRSVKELAECVFGADVNRRNQIANIPDDELLELMAQEYRILSYNLKVAMAGIRREKRINDKLRQIKLL